jgi:hypothetical protein
MQAWPIHSFANCRVAPDHDSVHARRRLEHCRQQQIRKSGVVRAGESGPDGLDHVPRRGRPGGDGEPQALAPGLGVVERKADLDEADQRLRDVLTDGERVDDHL